MKTVQIDGQVFDLLANIRKKPNGEYVYSIQLNENNKKSASPVAPAYGLQQEAGYASEWGTADGNSISQSRQKSKGENLNQGIRYSAETDTQQDMEAETLRKLADLMPGVKRRDLQAIMSDIKGGVIEAQLMADFWDQYDNIRVADYTKEAQELQEVGGALQGRKIYADDSLKAEFGDDWNDIRKKAFGNRLYFTSKRGTAFPAWTRSTRSWQDSSHSCSTRRTQTRLP